MTDTSMAILMVTFIFGLLFGYAIGHLKATGRGRNENTRTSSKRARKGTQRFRP